jgi:lysophospholipase L1-like esterase
MKSLRSWCLVAILTLPVATARGEAGKLNILIRYGLNDVAKRERFAEDFPKDYAELIGRLRRDFPRATIVPMTIIPYMTPERDESVNRLIRKVAESEHLALFDVYTRYKAELEHGPDMLNYRRYPIEKISEKDRVWVKPFVREGWVVVMDNRLDAHFRDLPNWFGDRHPNPAGYHVIGDESARFLAKLIREKKTTKADAAPGKERSPRPQVNVREGGESRTRPEDPS